MKCNNCNLEVNEGEIYCNNCGASIAMQEMNASISGVKEIKVEHSGVISSRELADVYIGKNVESLKYGGFSFPYFFWGIEYAVYRKMWGLAFGWLAIAILLALTPIFEYALIIVHLIISFNFKEWYLRKVESDIFNIKLKNGDKSNDELIKICKKRGGTSVLAIFGFSFLVAFIVPLTIIFITAIMYLISGV